MAIPGARPDTRQISPHLIVRDGARAVDFYERAFGAVQLYRSEMPGGIGLHAQLRIADSTVLITDENLTRNPQLRVAAPTYTFFGDRYGWVMDPFGHLWSLATVKEVLTPEQVAERLRAYSGQMS